MKKINVLYMLLLAQSKSFANVINFKYDNKPVQFNCADLDIASCAKVLDVKLENLNKPESVQMNILLNNLHEVLGPKSDISTVAPSDAVVGSQDDYTSK
jgi:hypothetical protein